MLSTLATALLTSLAMGVQQPDTTITVAAGTRLDVYAQGGEIVVDTWQRDEVRVEATHGSRDRIRVTTAGSIVRVRSESERGPGIIDYRITVPAAMDLELEGIYTEISVSGTRGQVRATTVQGDVTVSGGAGQVEIRTVQGSVLVEGAQASVSAESVQGEIRVRDVRGPVQAETVSGRVVLENLESAQVSASAVSGRIFFEGAVAEGGSYSFASHSGRVTLAVPSDLNATLSVAVLSGSFSSSIPSLRSTSATRGRRQSFTAGNGNAMIEVESFSGDIRIVNQGEVSAPPGGTRGP